MSQVKSIVCISDVLSGTVDNVHVVPNDLCAIRSLGDLVRLHPDHEMVVHSADFALVHLGEIEMDTGVIHPDKYVICQVSEFVENPVLPKTSECVTDKGAAVGV